ncbi:MAG: homoserine dehydrogenase [Phycisphaeraceae bacterium]|nr:homoserine dehydrogenase [Phycisphaerales bacterium]MCB9859200.1 homoserine dehydrogenase [Phycisphaeraceae bacterium]
MSGSPLIVLKFGGSVLIDETSLRIAVHEIYRWRRDGYRVVAVVSAFAGATDALVCKAESISDDALPHTKAALIATGETVSAATLGVCLDAAGIPSTVFSPGAIQLRATGDALDATPVSVDGALIKRALDRDGVVVVPGFAAIDESGRTVTLGRGGSDQSALFLAYALGTDRCRLIKDVDGLYEWDPAIAGTPPRRFERISCDDALQLDGSIIQHKAVQFARDHEITFELGAFNATQPTVVSGAASVLETPRAAAAPTRVALLGLGTVGSGVLELLNQLPDEFDVVAACARNPDRHADKPLNGIVVSGDPVVTADTDADVVVEVIGGIDVARDAVTAALRNGTHVVTANKALIADFGESLAMLADNTGAALLCSGAVGGAVPVLEHVRGKSVQAVRGVVNGTTNFILNQIADSISFDAAIDLAQGNGFAEADPSRDLDGTDAVDKLRVIAECAGVRADEVRVDRQQSVKDAGMSRSDNGVVLRHVATLDRDGRIGVLLTPVSPDDALYDLPGAWNAVEIVYSDGSSIVLRGKGAGRLPTAQAVVADLLELRRNLQNTANITEYEPEVVCA